MDALDEKVALTAFTAGLGLQSKDLLFSISKNPHATMEEVLAKAEKYINWEEALLSKGGSSSTHERCLNKKRKESSPKRGRERREWDCSPRRDSDRFLKQVECFSCKDLIDSQCPL